MSLHKGSLGIGEVYKGNLPIASIYKGSNLIWQNKADITFKIIEDGKVDAYSLEQCKRHSVVYSEKISDYQPITYNNGVCDLGSWGDWIENHFTPVMLKSDGTVDYELSKTNQNYKSDGVTQSDIANINYNGNAMLRIKKFYISCSTETVGSGGNSHKEHTIKISDSKKDNTYTCWGFVDANGVEHDYAYYGLFMGHVDSNNKLRSISGVTLTSSNHYKSYSDIVTAAKANGNGWNISNIALENAIGLVLIMLFKEINPMFIQREDSLGYESASNYVVTGSRANTDGFPACISSSDILKALWIEGYWRSYATDLTYAQWVNGFGSLRDSQAVNEIAACYKLKEPFDLTDINSWIKSDIPVYYWGEGSRSSQPTSLMFNDNLLLPSEKGSYWGGTYGISNEKARSSYVGGGDLNGNANPFHSTSNIYPGNKCGAIFDASMLPPHFLSYGLYGNNSTATRFQISPGRLTYLQQPANS